ncbi:MAG: ABC transporter ATP-binding protein [Candidatus Moranbacteria bacterium]|nr:ABC transporter ATP-binding protein [Candidatus Moranbacteria bacterium]
MTAFWWIVGLIATTQIMFRAGDYAIAYIQSNLIKKITDKVFAGLQKHSERFFSENFSGSLVTKAKRYVRSFEDLFDSIVFSIWMTFVSLVGILVTLTVVSPALGIIFFVWICVYLAIASWFAKKKTKYDLIVAKEDSFVVGRLADVISNILAVKMMSSGKREIKSFGDKTNKEERARRKAWNFQNIIFMTQIGMLSILEIGGMYMAIQLWHKGVVSAGTVALVQIYISSIFGLLYAVGRIFAKMSGSISDANEMIDILSLKPSVTDPQNPQQDKIKKGEIVFHNVAFTYSNGEKVFKDISFKIRENEKVGLAGPSGAGKSTITKLLLRFADCSNGKITIDDQDVSKITQDDLRSHIAYVPQEPVLFHRSIRENISYAKPEASEEEMISAAKKAQAHEFIMRLPKQYDTLVGERGVKLSGGQRQRIAIARAILKDAQILVLDEATSSLDSESEHVIQRALDELMKDKTAVVIAHRLSTIKKMDRIIVLNENGQIEEEGKHEELLKNSGLYARMWNRQTGGFVHED